MSFDFSFWLFTSLSNIVRVILYFLKEGPPTSDQNHNLSWVITLLFLIVRNLVFDVCFSSSCCRSQNREIWQNLLNLSTHFCIKEEMQILKSKSLFLLINLICLEKTPYFSFIMETREE